MGGIALAWLFGESIVVYRWIKAGAPPTPGALLLSSGVFAGLALLAQAQQARVLAGTLAWGFDLAILLQVLPGGVGKVPGGTGWPPAVITDGRVILPNGHAHAAPSAPSGSGGSGIPGQPGNPVPGQPGVTFPNLPL